MQQFFAVVILAVLLPPALGGVKRPHSEVDETTTTAVPFVTEDAQGRVAPLIPFTEDSPIPPRHKVMYSNRFLDSLHPAVTRILTAQARLDLMNERSVPLLDYDIEQVREIDAAEAKTYHLGPLIAEQSGSIIYALAEDPTKVIKYQENCDTPTLIHPLIHDFWMLSRLAGTGVVPRVHALSPAVKFQMKRTAKTDFRIAGALRQACADHFNTHVRYMVMDRAHRDLWEIATQKSLSIRQVLELLIGTISGLEKIHDEGIVHGDIHSGNVVIMGTTPLRIGFIDFGRAFMIETKDMVVDRPRSPLELVHPLLSTYELDGFRSSFRDDVFRAVMMGGLLLNGVAYSDYLKGLDGPAMMRFKSSKFLFTIPGQPDKFELQRSSSEDHRIQLKQHFQRVIELVRNIPGIDDRPPYPEILAELEAAKNLVPPQLLVPYL